jgi:hypothetical protein
MLMTRCAISLALATVFIGFLSSCESSPGRNVNPICGNGQVIDCPCSDGSKGSQSCVNGHFAACACNGPARCGDGICNNNETCQTCPDDCNICAACNAAPSCTNAVGIPANPPDRSDLDIWDNVTQPAPPDGGMSTPPPPDGSNCRDPQVRVRIASISVQQNGGQYYCIIDASNGAHSEAAVTDLSKQLGDGETNYFDPSVGVFWGQQALVTTSTNLTITYKCYRTNNGAASVASVLTALGNAAAQQGGMQGMYGWAFGAGAAGAAAAAAAAKAASGDDERLNEQQTIDVKTLLDLTNGKSWQIHKRYSRGFLGVGNYELSLTVEAWGCADARPPRSG